MISDTDRNNKPTRKFLALLIAASLVMSFVAFIFNTNFANVAEAYVPGPKYTFVAAGDFGCSSGASPYADDVVREADELDPDKFIMLGDYSYETRFNCFYTMLTTEAPDLFAKSKNPTSALLANHELDGCATTCLDSIGKDQFFGNYSFANEGDNTGYSFDQNGVHFLMLNSEKNMASGSTQYNFAKADLKRASLNDNINWIVVGVHDPFFYSPTNTTTTSSAGQNHTISGSCTSYPYTNCAYHVWQPLFDQNRVDLVLSGDVHLAERLMPMFYNLTTGQPQIDSQGNSTAYANSDGQIYLTIGTGGRHGKTSSFPHNTFDTTNRPAMSAVQNDDSYGFYKFVVGNNGTRITATFVDHTGLTEDSFNIQKSTEYNYMPYYTVNNTSYDSSSDASKQLADDFSVAAWFRTNSDLRTETVKQMIVNKGGFQYDGSGAGTPEMNYGIWMMTGACSGCSTDDSGRLEAGFETTSGSNKFITSDKLYNDGKWHFAVLTYEKDSAVMKLYVDGTLDNTVDHGSNVVPDSSSTDPVRIGADSNNATLRKFIGHVDEARVFSKELTSTEVTNLYTSNTVPSNQVAYMSPTNNAGAAYRSDSASDSYGLESVKYREWSDSAGWDSEVELADLNSDVRDVRLYQSPVSTTKIILSHSADGTINLFDCDTNCTTASSWERVSGSSIADTGSPNSGTPYLFFDGAFEATTGRFIIVYDKSGTVTDDFYTRIYDPRNDTLSAEFGYNYIGSSTADDEEVRYFKLTSSHVSGQIVMVLHDGTNTNAYAFVWNPDTSSWGYQLTLTTSTSGVTQETGAAFESASGAAVVFSSNGAGSAAWARWDGDSWSGPTSTDPVSGASNEQVRYTIVKADPNPTSNKVMICAVTVSAITISCAQENGGTMGGWTKILEENSAHNARRPFDYAWDTKGSTGLVLYIPASPSGAIYYRTWNGSSFSTNSTLSVAGLATWIVGDTNAHSASFSDTVESLWMKLNNDSSPDIGAIKWDGTTLTLISDSSFTANAGGQTFEGMSIAFDRISPPLN